MKKIKIFISLLVVACVIAACGNNKQGEDNIEAIEIIEPEINESEINESEINESEIDEVEIIEPETDEKTSGNTEATEEEMDLLFELTLTENVDGSVHAKYVISDVNGKEIQIIENDPNFTKDWYDLFSGNCCFFEDYNFDGKVDVGTINSGGYVNAYNYIYIWDADEKQFVYSEDASNIANAVMNSEKEQIISISRDAGLPIYRLYEVKDGKITLVAELLEETTQDGIIINTETLYEIDQVTDITNLNQLNEIWDGYNIEIFN